MIAQDLSEKLTALGGDGVVRFGQAVQLAEDRNGLASGRAHHPQQGRLMHRFAAQRQQPAGHFGEDVLGVDEQAVQVEDHGPDRR